MKYQVGDLIKDRFGNVGKVVAVKNCNYIIEKVSGPAKAKESIWSIPILDGKKDLGHANGIQRARYVLSQQQTKNDS